MIESRVVGRLVFPEIVPSIGNSFINTMKNINHTRSSISDDIRNILCSSANMRRAFCRKLAAERPLKDIRDEYNYPKKKGIKDECSRLLEASTMKSRRGFAIQRLMNAMRQAHADGWFIVFDTLTLADDRLE